MAHAWHQLPRLHSSRSEESEVALRQHQKSGTSHPARSQTCRRAASYAPFESSTHARREVTRSLLMLASATNDLRTASSRAATYAIAMHRIAKTKVVHIFF